MHLVWVGFICCRKESAAGTSGNGSIQDSAQVDGIVFRQPLSALITQCADFCFDLFEGELAFGHD